MYSRPISSDTRRQGNNGDNMRAIAFAILLIAAPISVVAQGYGTGYLVHSYSADQQPVYDDTDVEKAMRICSKNSYPSNFIYPTNPARQAPNEYILGWGACYTIRSAWEKSEAAKLQREAEEQRERDSIFVNELAEKLKAK